MPLRLFGMVDSRMTLRVYSQMNTKRTSTRIRSLGDTSSGSCRSSRRRSPRNTRSTSVSTSPRTSGPMTSGRNTRTFTGGSGTGFHPVFGGKMSMLWFETQTKSDRGSKEEARAERDEAVPGETEEAQRRTAQTAEDRQDRGIGEEGRRRGECHADRCR